MAMKEVLKKQILFIRPDKKIFDDLKREADRFKEILEEGLRDERLNAEVFIGGSFAKGTLLRKYDYDVDVFVRFDWKYDNISDLLGGVLLNVGKKLGFKVQRLHGSRDYFRVRDGKEYYFEVIPVTKIKKPSQERNVTDLSYFHVPYVKRKIKGSENDLRLLKTFCHAQKVYGAETYVGGFSGYALECLIIHYGKFEKVLKELVKVKKGERIVIDIEKKYKRKDNVFFDMNENKLQSPVIIVDPTYKDRNALASLSRETFEKFQKSARDFLKKPSLNYFKEKSLNIENLKKRAKSKKAEFVHVKIKTDKQAGDIAGTKLKKFHYVIENELKKYFKLVQHEFVYDENSPENSQMLGKGGLPSHNEKQTADFYIIVKSKKEVIRIGPPLKLKKHVRAFKKEHRQTFEKNGFIHARIKINFTARSFVDAWEKQRTNRQMMKEMGITGIKVLD